MTKRRYEKDGAIWRSMFDVNADIAMMESELVNLAPLDEEFPVKNLRRDFRRTEKETTRKRTIALREAKKAERKLREMAKKEGKKLDTVYVEGFVMKARCKYVY